MATGALVSVEEYLATSYRPECEFIDGFVVERNVGEWDHSSLLGAMTCYLFPRQKQWETAVRPTLRVRVSPTRVRAPDICVLRGRGPFDPVIQKPPFICMEILARQDTVDNTQERIADYLSFGVAYVWVINPRTRRAFVYTAADMYEAEDGILRTENPEIVVPLAEVFDSIV